MITRARPSATVCLRCQLRDLFLAPSTSASSPAIAVAVTRSRRPRTIPTNARFIHSSETGSIVSSQRVDEDLDGSNTPAEVVGEEEEKPRFKITRIQVGPKEDPQAPYEQVDKYGRRRVVFDPAAKRIRPIAEPRLHGYLGAVSKEKIEDVKYSALGKESEVIVLKDAGIRYTYALPKRTYAEDPESVDILARLDAERGIVGQEQVNANIEELRPRELDKLFSWEEFQAVEKSLNEGFTITQLTRYIGAQKDKQLMHKNIEAVEATSAESSVSVSAWMPGKSEEGMPFYSSWLRGYVAEESFTQKQRLVVLLMRQCWHMEVEEVVEGRGEIEVHVRSDDLGLLIKGKPSPLKTISDTYLKSTDDQIEVFQSRQVILITANRNDAVAVAQAIKAAVDNINRIEIDLDPLKPSFRKSKEDGHNKILTTAEIKEIESLTDTMITSLPHNKLRVSGAGREVGTILSSPVDTARRLLLPGTDAARLTMRQIGLKELDQPLVAVRYDDKAGLPWRDRLRSWVRWTTGVEKNGDTTGTKKKGSGKLNAVHFEEFTKSRPQDNAGKTAKKKNLADFIWWDVKSFTTSSVVVGHVLHESKVLPPIVSSASTLDSASHTEFLSTSQNLAHFLKNQECEMSEPGISVRMRFIPSPWGNSVTVPEKRSLAKQLAPPPPINMRFAINSNTKELVLKDILAVTESTASDVMLPDRAVDLRFRQRVTRRLQTLHRRQLPEVTRFLLESQLNTSVGPIVTPPSLTLPVSGLVDHVTNHEIGEVEYLFAGLEFRTTLAASFEGWRLLYTVIDGGKADGQRTELSLRPSRTFSNENSTSKDPENLQQKRSRQFIDSAYNLVDALESSGPEIKIRKTMPALVKRVSSTVRRSTEPKEFTYFKKPVEFKIENWLDQGGIDELQKAMEADEQNRVQPQDEATLEATMDPTEGVDASTVWGETTPRESDVEAAKQ